MNSRALLSGAILAGSIYSANADAFDTTLYYTRYSGSPNVRKVDVSFDGSLFSVSSPVDVGTTFGADGIVGNPQNSDLLIVGGQGTTINTIDRNTGFVIPYATPVPAFHLAVPTSDTLLASGIPGSLARHAILPGGAIGPGSLITVDQGSVTTIIPAPGGQYYFTDAGSSGNGDFGKITFDAAIDTATSATTALIASGVISAHGGAYDPFSNTILLFGGGEISQWTLAGTLLGSRTFSATFDQGAVDGAGHLFVASNGGELLMIDYEGDGQVYNPSNPTYFQFLDSFLDDIAPLIGEGGTNPVPEPSTVFGGLALAGLCLSRAFKRKK